ncbi:PH domain-containing protein [Patescibacteria group bacterium]
MIKLESKFPGQRDQETTVLLARVHWARFAGHITLFLFLAVVWFIAFILLQIYFPALLSEMWGQTFVLFSSAYFLFLLLFLFIGWLNYYLDVWIVTNERLVDIDQKSLFDRSISQLSLSKIQNVKAEMKGILPTFLRFGDVDVESAGADVGRFSFRSIPNPFEVERKVLELSQYVSEHISKGQTQSGDSTKDGLG